MKYQRLLTQRGMIYLSPDDLLKGAVEYFEFIEEAPLQEEVLFHYRGHVTRTTTDKIRAASIKGLASFLGITEARLRALRNKGDDWADAFDRIEQVIYTQKFEAAAAGLLNATIISRELGLAEKQQISGVEGAPPVEFNIMPVKTGTFIENSDGG